MISVALMTVFKPYFWLLLNWNQLEIERKMIDKSWFFTILIVWCILFVHINVVLYKGNFLTKIYVRIYMHLRNFLHKCSIIVISYIERQWIVILCFYTVIITWWIKIINLIFVFCCSCKNNFCKIAVIYPDSWILVQK